MLVEENKTKVCKICGKEKSVGEFHSKGSGHYATKCKVCVWFETRAIKYDDAEWNLEDDINIIDYLLNKKGNINDISNNINKSLYDVCFRIKEILKLNAQTKLPVILNCESCKNNYETTPARMIRSEIHFCTKECHNNWTKENPIPKIIIGQRDCINCHKEFNIINNVPDQKFCCQECKSEYYYYVTPKYENKVCTNCSKEYTRHQQSERSDNSFCSLECELEYKHSQNWEFRKCEICKEEFECLKSSPQIMCSIQCQGKWQSINLSGENANGYNHEWSIEDRTVVCEWCGLEHQAKPYQIENGRRFCSDKCRQDWFAKEYSQTEDFKNNAAIRAVKMLEDDVFNQRVTGIQIIINDLLSKLNINNKSEKVFGKVALDNYLIDSGLMIENMGTFYHCDHRKYPQIIYERQVNRIRMDKIKHSYLRNNHNVEVLYLWEEEINNNTLLCEQLINLYVKNNGKLDNYHSFNYKLNSENVLELNDVVFKPYMAWDIEELHKIIDTSTKEKMSHKQLDKWTIFNCEYCGIETEQLTGKYNTSEHHYCSTECSGKAQIKRFIVYCNNCNEEISVIQDKYITNKRFFCDQKCQHEYQKRVGFQLKDNIILDIQREQRIKELNLSNK